MTKPWHVREPQRLADLQRAVIERYPTLRFVLDEHRVALTGTYSLCEGATLIEEFRISMELPHEFPRALPVVHELDGKVPPLQDFHRNASDGALCVVLPDDYWLGKKECDLVAFLDGPLRNYFLGVVHFREHGTWPFGEHAHGADGVFRFYAGLFGTDDRDVVTRYLELLSKRELKPFWECPCGSGKRLKKCHWLKALELHKRVRPDVAFAALERIEPDDDE